MKKKKRSICLIIATAIATAYMIYFINYFIGGADTNAGTVALMIAMPHGIALVLGVLFGWIACLSGRPAYALVSVILYVIAALIFIMYGMFLIPSIILGFVGYERQKKLVKD